MSNPSAVPRGTDTPAIRFLNRGKQLNRIQQRVLTQMLSEVEAEQSALPKEINTPEEAQRLVAQVMSGLGSSHDRFSDVDLTLQLFYCRHVDNFQIFLEELLRTILTRQPGLLRRGEPVPMDEVLSHTTMESFIETSIDRHIHRLAYKSIQEFSQIIKEQTGFAFFQNAKIGGQVEKIFALRNLITHNYGIVNQLYLAKYPDSKLTVGEPYPYTPEDIRDAWQVLVSASGDIEGRARPKFKIFNPAG